ncbi:hypothetical protein [Candidatus Halocynthiibacter alkanivorans]|nr:hypothetical protein [Candidatus Halocynthiibacter alkanivorans]
MANNLLTLTGLSGRAANRVQLAITEKTEPAGALHLVRIWE